MKGATTTASLWRLASSRLRWDIAEVIRRGSRGFITQQEPEIPDNAYLPYDVETIEATIRELPAGRLPSARLRKMGRTPGMLVALEGNKSLPLSMDAKAITKQVRLHGRSGFVSRIYNLKLLGSEPWGMEYRVLPRQVHMNAVTGVIENVNFLYCPPEKWVVVPIPVKVLGEDVAPGVKKGGFIRMVRWHVTCLCPGWIIPPFLEVDASHLDSAQSLSLLDVQLPDGVYFAEKHITEPILKVTGKSRGR
eukprot:jgi/Botrbrau1/16541/Bobra.0327s0008.1